MKQVWAADRTERNLLLNNKPASSEPTTNDFLKMALKTDSLCGFIQYVQLDIVTFKDCTKAVGYFVETAAGDSAPLSVRVWCDMSDVILMEKGQWMCICSKKTWKSSTSALSHFKMKFLPSLIWQTCVWYSLQRKVAGVYLQAEVIWLKLCKERRQMLWTLFYSPKIRRDAPSFTC